MQAQVHKPCEIYLRHKSSNDNTLVVMPHEYADSMTFSQQTDLQVT